MSLYKINSGEHIDDIISRIPCAKHDAPIGFACFEIEYGGERAKQGPAVCGNRIRKAGFNGKIHPSSLSRTR